MTFKEFVVGEIAEQIRGVSYQKDVVIDHPSDGYIPILRANNIGDNFKLILKDLIYVPQSFVSKKQFLKPGDIVIAASSGSKSVVGKAAGFDENFECSFGAFCKVIRPKSKLITDRYLGQFFQSNAYRSRISSLATGANILNLRNADLDGLVVRAPEEIEEQNKIVAALDKAKFLIDKRQRSIELLDELLRATFLIQFQQKFNRTDELIELGEVISDGPQNGIYKHSDHYGSGTRILRIDGFYDGVVTGIDGLKRVQLNEKEVKTYSLEKDDIVINRVNSREYLGKSAIIPELSEETVFESNMMRFKVNRERMLPKFLIYVLQQDFIKAQILKRAKDAINQSSINQQDVKSLKVPKCSIQEQQLFQTLFEQTTLIRDKYLKGLLVMQELFQSLLQRAFHGDLSFDIDLQLDAFLSNEDFDAISRDDVFIQRLIDRFNQHNHQNGEAFEGEKSFKFTSSEDYERAKKILFNLMKANKVGQVYDKVAKKTTIEML